MSLLTPLYILGLLAVSLPVLFHLIRRSPRGQMPFSTLMFLRPSPPRLTRKSRLDNLLLLLLRALILVLLVLAFTRPFWREASLSDTAEGGVRRVVILVDTSASMRRATLWPKAVAQVGEVLDDLGPGDDVGLYAFDADVRPLVKLNDVVSADPREHAARVRAALEGVAPTWAASDLGRALSAVAEELNQIGNAKDAVVGTTRQVVLISDMQEGCRLDALRAYDWPGDVDLVVHRLAASKPTNAGLHLATDPSEAASSDDGIEEIRVRVSNDRDSQVEEFQVQWAGAEGAAVDDRAVAVHVPPGESRVVRVPRLPELPMADRLVLAGDDEPFDNTLYVVAPRQEPVSLLYIGADEADDARTMRYSLERAFPETPRRKVDFIARRPDEPLADDELAAVPLIVVTDAIPDERAAQLKDYMEQGGDVLYVLRDAAGGATLGALMGREGVAVEQVDLSDYALWGEISLKHPLFAPFALPQYNDFTKIHFWRYRRVDVAGAAGVEVVARFDQGDGGNAADRDNGRDRDNGTDRGNGAGSDAARSDRGDPALFEQAHGKGRLIVMTSGWHPADSQLARSSKFPPLLSGILERAGVGEPIRPQYDVGDEVLLTLADRAAGDAVVRKPDGSERNLGSEALAFAESDEPGVYGLSVGDRHEAFAVNVAAAESATTPMEVGQLEQFGVRAGDRPTRIELAEQRRQMRDLELEGRQKIWRGLIVAALGVLIVETWLAGHMVRRTQQPAIEEHTEVTA